MLANLNDFKFLKDTKKIFFRSSEVPFTRSSEVTYGFLQIYIFGILIEVIKKKLKSIIQVLVYHAFI